MASLKLINHRKLLTDGLLYLLPVSILLGFYLLPLLEEHGDLLLQFLHVFLLLLELFFALLG